MGTGPAARFAYYKKQFLGWFEGHGRTKFSDDPADPQEVTTGELLLFEDPDSAAPAS